MVFADCFSLFFSHQIISKIQEHLNSFGSIKTKLNLWWFTVVSYCKMTHSQEPIIDFGSKSDKNVELEPNNINEHCHLNLEIPIKHDKNINDEHPCGHWFLCGFRWSQVKWTNVLWLVVLHSAFLVSYGYVFMVPVKFNTVVWCIFTSVFSGFGMSVGAHRLWAHKSFRASLPVRLLLLILQTMTVNGSALSYARDHRNHHKWTHTHADPKNPDRGFFFSHIGWWMLKKRPEVIEYGGKVDSSDLHQDALLMFQHRFYIPLVVVWAFLVPVAIPVYAWNERVEVASALCVVRIVVVLHHMFLVNSVAHIWGYRPYNR